MINNFYYDNLLKKFNDVENQFNNLLNIDTSNNILDLYKKLVEMRIYHGYIIRKIYVKNKLNQSIKKYFTISLLKSLSNNMNNTIENCENKFKKLYSNNKNFDISSIKNLDFNIFNKQFEKEFNYDSDNEIKHNSQLDHKEKINYKDKNSILYFYLPTCGYCKSFDKTWEALKLYCNDNKININLVKIDCSNEDSNIDKIIKMFSVYGYPSIYFVNKNMSIIRSFEYERTPDNLIDFIKKNNKY